MQDYIDYSHGDIPLENISPVPSPEPFQLLSEEEGEDYIADQLLDQYRGLTPRVIEQEVRTPNPVRRNNPPFQPSSPATPFGTGFDKLRLALPVNVASPKPGPSGVTRTSVQVDIPRPTVGRGRSIVPPSSVPRPGVGVDLSRKTLGRGKSTKTTCDSSPRPGALVGAQVDRPPPSHGRGRSMAPPTSGPGPRPGALVGAQVVRPPPSHGRGRSIVPPISGPGPRPGGLNPTAGKSAPLANLFYGVQKGQRTLDRWIQKSTEVSPDVIGPSGVRRKKRPRPISESSVETLPEVLTISSDSE